MLFAEGLQGSLSRIAVQLTENFLKGPARYLLLDLSNENEPLTKNALEDIFSSAARLALSLWTQKSYLKCLDLRDFSLFSNGRDEIGAHALHHLDDDDDTRLNGQQVLLIVQPALIAFGNDDAEHYEQHKVWAKAMVLVDERS